MNPHFAAFLQEGLNWINAWTPTEINEGGCGVFANLLSEKLTEYKIEHKILALYFGNEKESHVGKENLKAFIQNNSEKNLKKAGEDHVVLYLVESELYVDSMGIRNPTVILSDERIEISKDTLVKLCEKGDWNPTFDRECIPSIKEKLNEMFEHMDTFDSGCFTYPGGKGVRYTDHTLKYKHMGSLENLIMQAH